MKTVTAGSYGLRGVQGDEKTACRPQIGLLRRFPSAGYGLWPDAPGKNRTCARGLGISRVEAKFKMSQNRRDIDIDGVVAGLAANGLGAVSETVDRLRRTAR
jgi:hypothetical protein